MFTGHRFNSNGRDLFVFIIIILCCIMNIYDSPNSWSPGKGSLDMLLHFSGFSYNIMCSRVDLVKRIKDGFK